MIYLFEDKEDDTLSLLYRRTLPEQVLKAVEYVNGNGNLVNRSRELIAAGERVLVILDTVPANKSIRDIYITLRKISRDNEYRLIVWNIVCAEYYFIKAFGKRNDLKVFRDSVCIDIVLSRLPYKGSSLISTEEDIIFSRTFEKFCKLYIYKNGGECVNETIAFFKEDCCCTDECTKISLDDKSDLYRKAYECIFEYEPSDEELWSIHRKLIERNNTMIQIYNDAGYLKINSYPVIREY